MQQISRILIFPPFPPDYIGGIVSHNEEFASTFAQQGIEVTLFTPVFYHSKRLMDESLLRRIPYPCIEPLLHFPIPKFWSFTFWKNLKKLQDRQYDCVFSRTRFFPISFFAFLFAKVKRLPIIHIEHGVDHLHHHGSFVVRFVARLIDATIARLIFSKADHVVAIAPDVKGFIHQFGREDVSVICRGLNFEQLKKVEPDHSLVRRYPKKILILWTGRMTHWKGVHHSIQAVSQLPPSIQNQIAFVLIGDGEQRPELELMAKNLPIFFLGAQSRETVIGFLKCADIFIHSSYHGGALSTSLLEAAFCKNALIASPFEGAREIVRDHETGLLVHAPFSTSIAASLELLIKNPILRKQLGEQAHQHVKQRFSWTRTVHQYLEIISSVQH